MDDYISKPVQARLLAEAIARVVPGGGGKQTAARATELELSLPAQNVFDHAAVIRRVDGNVDLLRELVDMFLEDTPRTLEKLRAAVAQADRRPGRHRRRPAPRNHGPRWQPG